MRTTIEDRLQYHPRVDESKRFIRGQRNSRARLDLIQSEVDFKDKTVLDLGCSGGFFALSVARQAKQVTAIDADIRIIEQNRKEANRLGLTNVEFIHENIEPEFVDSLPHADIVLFLSVFHHILAATEAYDWNQQYGQKQAQLLLDKVGQLADTYVFEMGESWEPRTEWFRHMSEAIGDTATWIPIHVFGSAYGSVQSLPGVGYQRWPFTRYPKLARVACNSRVGRTLLRQSGLSRSDFRTIYIGSR